MLPETSKLPTRWLISGGIAAAIVAVLLARMLFVQPSRGRGEPQPHGPGKQSGSDITSPDDTPKDQVSLQQSTAAGETIPWAGVSPSSLVLLEVNASNPEDYDSAKISLSRNGGSYTQIDGDGLKADAQHLDAGHYRWRAALKRKGSSLGTPIEPPRAKTTAPDFIVPPPKLELKNLQQTQLDSSPIGSDLRTESGAMLKATINDPDAVLEVEIKPAGVVFDGRIAERARTTEGGDGQIPFTRSDGPYRWRARGRSNGGMVTPWQEFRKTPKVDFIIYHQHQEPDNSENGKSGAGTASMSLGNDLGQGGQVRPSIVEPSPTLWSMLISRSWVISAGILVAASALWSAARGISSRRRRARR